MSEATLLVESGARRVDRHELAHVEVPEATATWKPVSHSHVVDVVASNLVTSGFRIQRQEFALAREDNQMFGVLDLRSEIAEGVTLAVGIRNSIDKSLSAAMCAGDRCLVCSNLCFGSEIQIARKHTLNVERDFGGRVHEAIARLRQFQQTSQARIQSLQSRIIPNQEAESIILRSFESGIVGARILPKLINEWRNPSYEEFETRTAWSLLNAYTHVVKDRQRKQPIAAAGETVQFQNFILTA